jgi:pimeloyl-ACP methyl ester carboxylesterase
MSSLHVQSVRTGFADFQGHQTWFRVTGELDPDADRAPVVILHGGPGAAHNYCLATTSLAEDGPSEFHVIGSLRDWTVVDRLAGVDVPTLVVAGEHDEARPEVWQPFVERIPDVSSHVFARSSHMPHVEEPEEFRRVVGDFLRRHD